MSEIVSVVLPVYNGAKTIARAVGSILQQTLPAIELIVVDDGSTDDTTAIVDAMSDARLRLVRAEHCGVTAAANLGTKHAQGEFIARMDADDLAHATRLEKQLALISQRTLDVVGCRVRIVDESGEPARGMRRYERWINEETLGGEEILALRFVEFPIVNPTILARRRYFDLGFREGPFPEDYDLMLRAASAGMRFGKTDEVLLDWTDAPSRLTRNDARYTREAFDRCRQMHLIGDPADSHGGPLAGAGEVDLWGVGQTGKPWLRWLQRNGIAVRRAYDVNQRKIDETIHSVRVAHADAMPMADGTPLVIAVGADGARDQIRPHLSARGYEPGRDAWFVA